MCVIFVADTTRPTADELQQAAVQNQDGIGVAWKDEQKGFVRWLKGLTLTQVQEMAQSLPLPYAIHFRFATIGGKSEYLAHPFPIEYKVRLELKGRTDRGLLMHNGTWSQWDANIPKKALNKGLWSDSRGIAWLLARAGSDKAFEELLVDHIPGKFAHIKYDGIETYGGFDVVRPGLTASNLYWRRSNYVHQHYRSGAANYVDTRGASAVYGDDYQAYADWYETETAKKLAESEHFQSWLNGRPNKPGDLEKEAMEGNPNYVRDAGGVWRHRTTGKLADGVAELLLSKGLIQDSQGCWRNPNGTFQSKKPASSTEQGSAVLGKDFAGVINLADYRKIDNPQEFQARVLKAREQGILLGAEQKAREAREKELAVALDTTKLNLPEHEVGEVEAGLRVVALDNQERCPDCYILLEQVINHGHHAKCVFYDEDNDAPIELTGDDVHCNECEASVSDIEIRGHNARCSIGQEAKAMDQGSVAKIDEESGQITWPGYESFDKELSGWD